MSHFCEDALNEPGSSKRQSMGTSGDDRLFSDEADVFASAPGRVEFIGNHTDYNGGGVLGATIDRRVQVALTRRDDMAIGLESTENVPRVEGHLSAVDQKSGDQSWANYILGMVSVLREAGLILDTGFDLCVDSTIPVGAGLSSSAALELATAFALTEAYGGEFDRKTLARLAQRAENDFVGVPCGLLDQAVVTFGRHNQLVHMDARTEDIQTVPFPKRTALWIFRTHQTHALADAHYQDRHDEARAARNQLQNLLSDSDIEYLVDVTPSQLEAVKSELSDTLYRRARHVSTEHRRVERVVRLLQSNSYEKAGELLFASHESSRLDYENSTEALDFVVDWLADASEVLGARLTGAGFGGAVMAWTRDEFGSHEVKAVKEAYAKHFETDLDVLSCRPAPGAGVHT